jgi:muramidase (phage lysozyme)
MANSTQEYYKNLLQKPEVRSFLNTISYAEGTPGTAGYQTMFTGKQFDPSKGWKHPRQIQKGGGYASDAAGKYQYLSTTWEGVQKELGLPDFSPQSQDIGALHLLKRRGALDPLLKGDVTTAIHKSAPEWASLPTSKGGSYYGQPSKSLKDLQDYYQKQLGKPIAAYPQGVTQAGQQTKLSEKQQTVPTQATQLPGQPININLIVPGAATQKETKDDFGSQFLKYYIGKGLETPQMSTGLKINPIALLTQATSGSTNYFG